ncbi:MAG: EamA family transporter [Pseudomonadota bacterium]|nr:EamA family transporter [Pseudomonadota bacterium]
MLGILFGILAAASSGFNSASARRGVIGGTPFQAMAISLPLGLITFAALAGIAGHWSAISRLDLDAVGFLAAGGFMHFVWGRYFNVRSLAAVGSNLAAPVQQFQLILALALAIIFLGETLTPLKILGIILVVVAPMYILSRRAKVNPVQESKQGEGFTPRIADGYVSAFLAGTGFGSSTVLIKAGLSDPGLSLVGGVVSYIAATSVVVLVLLLPCMRTDVLGTTRQSAKWFVYSGFGVSVMQLFRFLAIGLAPVTVVQPLQSLSVIFRLIFGYFINRDHEAFELYVITGILLSFVGALSLTLSVSTVTDNLDLPLWIQAIISWRWP